MDLTPVIAPIVVSVILSVTGAVVVTRFAGPAQATYVAALEGRLKVVQQERDEALLRVANLEQRVQVLEQEVVDLRDQASRKDRKLAALYERLDEHGGVRHGPG